MAMKSEMWVMGVMSVIWIAIDSLCFNEQHGQADPVSFGPAQAAGGKLDG